MMTIVDGIPGYLNGCVLEAIAECDRLAALPGLYTNGAGLITGIPALKGKPIRKKGTFSSVNAEVIDDEPAFDEYITPQTVALCRFYF